MKHAFKRLTALIMIMVFTCISLIGCTKHTQKNDIRKITLNEVAHSIFYAPQYVAIEKGYFKDEGIDLTLVTGFGADKVMTALISGDADIGFMGSEASVYIYTGGSSDYAVNFAQLTQRAGNFLVSRDNISNFKWSDVKGKTIIGGRAGGMPQMLLEYILKKNNIDLKYNVVEDAPTVYGIQYKENKCIKYLFKIFNLKSSIRNINCWWFSSPESMSPFKNGKKQKLPMVSRQNKKMCQTINYVFEYKEDVDLQNADVILMEECYSNDGLIKNEDIELFKQVIDIDKKFNAVVKLHPRSKINRFENKFNIIKSQGIPWEVYILNCPMKDKILISLSCATMTSGKFMFGEESYSLLLFPIIEDKVIDTYDKSKYFTEERKKKLSSQKQMYDDKNKFFIACTVKEAKNKLFEWLDNKNE